MKKKEEPNEPISYDQLKEIGFGWLGLLPEDFYRMKLSDFMIMQKGYFDKRKKDDFNFANVAFIIDAFATGLAGKRANYKTFIKGWFGESEKPLTHEQLAKRSEEIMKRVELTNKILAEKEKVHGRADENSN